MRAGTSPVGGSPAKSLEWRKKRGKHHEAKSSRILQQMYREKETTNATTARKCFQAAEDDISTNIA